MLKRKVDGIARQLGIKRSKQHDDLESVAKPTLFDGSDTSEDESVGGVKLEVNEDYAKRFEHNKKREELMRLEEKYQGSKKPADTQDVDDSDSSTDEDEDDEGFLATEELDESISKTLQALRSKDPRVYDENVTFCAPIEEDVAGEPSTIRKEKPMYLTDYHRENLLKGHTGGEEEDQRLPRTFAQEQADLKDTIIKEMHAVAEDSSDSNDEDGGFLLPKSKPADSHEDRRPLKSAKVEVDVSTADKDPETFLSNFMAARAWLPGDGSRFQAFESDEEDEDERAEQFEAAYNLRFEDPKTSNETLKSYARDIVAAKSVRREKESSRRKQRDAEREKREAEKKERDEERARLKRLKIDEMAEKLQKIKKAAGISGKTIEEEEWSRILEEGWDDAKWDVEMNKRFGEDYYAEKEIVSDMESIAAAEEEPNKPKWDDDIDIKDLVPEFEGEEQTQEKPAFTLCDSEAEEDDDNEEDAAPKKSKKSKNHKQERQEKKRAARLERLKIEALVDDQLGLDVPIQSRQSTLFRYRDTSPTSFGLTARDILMAPDAALNEFAGLKKLGAFRDVEKKRKDKKRLSKKARLRNWRKETFGDEEGQKVEVGNGDPGANGVVEEVEVQGEAGVDVVEGKKKRKNKHKKRSRGKGKVKVEQAVE